MVSVTLRNKAAFFVSLKLLLKSQKIKTNTSLNFLMSFCLISVKTPWLGSQLLDGDFNNTQSQNDTC